MTLVPAKPSDIIKMCPDHPKMALCQEPFYLPGGNQTVNYYRCPIDHKLFDDVPESRRGTLSSFPNLK